MAIIINLDLIQDAAEYFAQFRQNISRRTMLEKGSEVEVEYRENLTIAARQLQQFSGSDLEVISASGFFLIDNVVRGDAQERVWLHGYLTDQSEVIKYQVQLESINAAINVLTGYEQIMRALRIFE